MKRYRLDCLDWNPEHVKFNVFDGVGANCGTLTIRTADVVNFLRDNWRGNLFWHGRMPQDFLLNLQPKISQP